MKPYLRAFLIGVVLTFILLKVASTRYRLATDQVYLLRDTWAGTLYRNDMGAWKPL
jgi:hypothetical protein